MNSLKKKIAGLIKVPQLMSLATVNPKGKPWVRYVVAFGGDDLSILFVTGLNSRKVIHIRNNPEVHLICGAAGMDKTSEYLQIAGKADVSMDPELRTRLWDKHLEQYFSGPDDPNYAVVIVQPYHIEVMGMTEMEPSVWEAD